MSVLTFDQEFDVIETINSYHHRLNRRVEFKEKEIINEYDIIENVVQLEVVDNKRNFEEKGITSWGNYLSDKDMILEDMTNLGLSFIKQYSKVGDNDEIIRVLCFRRK